MGLVKSKSYIKICNMNLIEAPENQKLRVVDINSGKEAKRKLISIGIRVNDIILKINSPGLGAILVQNISTDATKVALGKGLGYKINVEVIGGS